MLPVSEAYKQAVQLHRTQGVRNRMYANVYFGEFDVSARSDAALLVNDAGAPYSEFANVNTDNVQDCSYATWEGDSFVLDGSQGSCRPPQCNTNSRAMYHLRCRMRTGILPSIRPSRLSFHRFIGWSALRCYLTM